MKRPLKIELIRHILYIRLPPEGSLGKKNLPAMQETREMQVQSRGGERSPGGQKWRPTPVLVPEKSHGESSLVVYSPKGCKESNTAERLSTHKHTYCIPAKCPIL